MRKATKGIFFKPSKPPILEMADFQKGELEVHNNVNSENPKVMKKNSFHLTKVAGDVISHVQI